LGIDIKPSPLTDRDGSICDRDFVRQCMIGVQAVIHSAALHKPHVATHTSQDFLQTNIAGTLLLLEEAVAAGVESFIFTSTTSAFGSALTPAAGEPAAWVTEDVMPIPKNIYGVTKVAAEDICELFSRTRRLPVIVLRTSRFFPEADDDAAIRGRYELANVQANEMLYRRVDIEDVVSAHFRAIDKRVPSASAATSFLRRHLFPLMIYLYFAETRPKPCIVNSSTVSRSLLFAIGPCSRTSIVSTSITGLWRNLTGGRRTIFSMC
jgi:UDP-glucose 4-epimerase